MELALPFPDDNLFAQWLSDARAGSTVALGRMLNVCYRCLVRCAHLQIGRDVQAELEANDLVQETFVRALKKFHSFVGTSAEEFQCWLVSILRRKASNLRRRYGGTSKRQLSREVPLDHTGRLGTPRDELEAGDPSPAQLAEDNEARERLADILRQLSEPQRQVVSLRTDERLPFEEIGRRMVRSAEAARKLYDRTRKIIIEKMKD